MFFKNDIVIKGEHATMMKELQSSTATSAITPTYIDIYLTAGAVGIVARKSSTERRGQENDVCNIPRNVLNDDRSESIEFLFQICALNEFFDLNEEQAVNIAFASSSNSDSGKLVKQTLFHEYALGGLEILYNQIAINPNDLKPIESTNDFLKQITSIEESQPFSFSDFLIRT